MPTYSSEWDPGDARANNEHRNRMGFGGTEHGGQQFAQRSRMLGDESQNRGAYQSDFGQSNQARGVTSEGVNLALSAARGNQPSAAEILSKRNTTAAVHAGRSLAGGIKGGPGARVAAMRNAQRMGAQQLADGQQRAEQLRADEMDRARGQVIQGGTALRSGDHDAQRIQQTNELTQRGLNDTQQRFFEQQGFNTQVQDQNNQLAQQAMANGAWQAGRNAEGDDEKFEFGKVMEFAKGAAGTAAGFAGGAAGAVTSDEAAKDLMPMGSLGGLSYGGTTGGSTGATKGGGMNVLAGQQWNNSQLRGMSGPGIMRSDMQGKDGVMFSPGEIKDKQSYPAFVAMEGERREDADPYMRVADTGVAGAPRGYAAARAGHAGSMFSEAPAVSSGYEKQTAQAGAPGTEDWNKYGAPAAKDDAVDWKHGGTTTEQGKKPNAVLGSLAGMLRGFSTSGTSTSDVTSKNGVMYSDDKTKLREAFEEGAKYSDAEHAGTPVKAPAYAVAKAGEKRKPQIGAKVGDAVNNASGDDAKKLRDVAIKASMGTTAATAPMVAFDHATDATAAAVRQGPDAQTLPQAGNAALDVGYAAAGPVLGTAARRIARSDEKAKHLENVDEESDRAKMRDGASDARTNSFDKSFRRDTKADQKAVKKGVEDKAGKDADAMMAGMRASLGKGPTARVEDVDSDDKPDLRNAAKESGKAGHIPEHAMFRAMKAMEPSLYSYKPEFKPPEQAPGEVQAGPMANNMQRDPIAGTAIVREPKTGLLAIDKDKALKLTMGSLAVLAQDVEEMKRKKKGAR